MENLNLPTLKVLILTGNLIKHIDGLEETNSLSELILQKNEITELNYLGLPPEFPSLSKLDCSYNKIPLEYFEELCKILQNLPALSELDLTGNEITLQKYYKYNIIQAKKNLKILDNMEIKGFVKQHIEVGKK